MTASGGFAAAQVSVDLGTLLLQLLLQQLPLVAYNRTYHKQARVVLCFTGLSTGLLGTGLAMG